MFDRLFRRDRSGAGIPAALYGAIVAQARTPALFRDFGVPDTVEGRFEMILMHLAVVLRNLRGADGRVAGTGQAVFDRFCTEMDRTLREMGIGDLSVGRKMRQVGEAYYGRAAAYEAPLAAGDSAALAAALSRNVYAGSPPAMAAEALAAYMIAADRAIARHGAEGLAVGTIPFPAPGDFLQAETRA